MNGFRRAVVGLGCVALVVSAPLNSAALAASSGRAPKSELDKAVGRCLASVGVGAVLGAVIGNNSGRGNAGRGAWIGAAAGGVVCAVMVKIANDKDQILERQREAVRSGGYQQTTFQGKQGPVTVTTRTREAQVAATDSHGAAKVCRYADSTVAVPQAGEASLAPQLYCRDDAGDWAIADSAQLQTGE